MTSATRGDLDHQFNFVVTASGGRSGFIKPQRTAGFLIVKGERNSPTTEVDLKIPKMWKYFHFRLRSAVLPVQFVSDVCTLLFPV